MTDWQTQRFVRYHDGRLVLTTRRWRTERTREGDTEITTSTRHDRPLRLHERILWRLMRRTPRR